MKWMQGESYKDLLVEEQDSLNVRGPALLIGPELLVAVLGTPNHGCELQTKSVCLGARLRAPVVVPGCQDVKPTAMEKSTK